MKNEYELSLQENLPIDFGIGTVVQPGARIHVDTSEHWNAQRDLIAKKNHLYVYTDYVTEDGVKIAGIKVGDGKAYLIDTPFIVGNTSLLEKHINDKIAHITKEERDFWNNKVTCFLSAGDAETIVFTKERENG
ncbi:MAG: hypothetical protein PUF17_10430 [Lactimicrobium massiliense]|nr:hypothetical protein [Lactimicrobium massiliense]MDD6561361.1 hypothetical protein [Lactimicrobium massiliense]